MYATADGATQPDLCADLVRIVKICSQHVLAGLCLGVSMTVFLQRPARVILHCCAGAWQERLWRHSWCTCHTPTQGGACAIDGLVVLCRATVYQLQRKRLPVVRCMPGFAAMLLTVKSVLALPCHNAFVMSGHMVRVSAAMLPTWHVSSGSPNWWMYSYTASNVTAAE